MKLLTLYLLTAVLLFACSAPADPQSDARLTGRVTDVRSGLPIPGATVGQGSAFVSPSKTNAQGEYDLPSFPVGAREEVFVRAFGYGLEVQDAPSGSARQQVDFELHPSRRVTGRIFRPDGEGAGGCHVAIITAGFPRDPDILNWYPGEVQPDGSFVVDGLQWGAHYAIFVRSDLFANVVYEFPQGAKTAENFEFSPIHLQPPATLRGVVRNHTGEPMPGVWLRFGDHNRNPDRFRYADPAPTILGQQTVNESYTQRDAQTDQLGRFTFTNLRPGPGFLDVLAEGHYRGPNIYVSEIIHVQQVELALGQELSGVEVVLPSSKD